MNSKSDFLISMSTVWCFYLEDSSGEDWDRLFERDGVRFVSRTETTKWTTGAKSCTGIIKLSFEMDYIEAFLLFCEMPLLWEIGDQPPPRLYVSGLKSYKSWGQWDAPSRSFA